MGARAAIAAIVAVLTYVVLSVPARAHASLVASQPRDGAVVAAAPSRLVLSFNEPVSPLVLRLLTPDGALQLLRGKTDGGTLEIALPNGLANGTHVISWRIVSLDGHPVGGTLEFSIGRRSANSHSSSLTGDMGVSATMWALKVVFFAGLFIGVGGSLFLTWFDTGLVARAPCIGRAAVMTALSAGLGATLLLVGLQGADALELPIAGLAEHGTWLTGLRTSFGATAVAAAIALAAGIVALKVRATEHARALALAATAAVGFALASSGHAASAAPQWLTRPAVFIHAVSVSFWIGALIPLAAMLSRAANADIALARFSRSIPLAVLALAISGGFLAVIQVGRAGAMIHTTYGLILCAKLGLVAALLTLAAWNRFRLTPAVLAGKRAPRRALARAISIEIAIASIVLGLVAAWRFTPPPRALEYRKPLLVHIHSNAAMANVAFEPGRVGIVQATIAVMTADFATLDAQQVLLTLENAAAGIEATSRRAEKGRDGSWRLTDLLIPAVGRWTVGVEILVNDFEKVTLEQQVDIER